MVMDAAFEYSKPPLRCPRAYTSHAGCMQVALMFLTRGDMPHEEAWGKWLAAAAGLVPLGYLQPGACSSTAGLRQPLQLETAAHQQVREFLAFATALSFGCNI